MQFVKNAISEKCNKLRYACTLSRLLQARSFGLGTGVWLSEHQLPILEFGVIGLPGSPGQLLPGKGQSLAGPLGDFSFPLSRDSSWGKPEQLPLSTHNPVRLDASRQSGSHMVQAGWGCPGRPGDLVVAFCQASVGAWFPHKAIMYWEN